MFNNNNEQIRGIYGYRSCDKKGNEAGKGVKKFLLVYQVALSNRNLKVFSFWNYKNLSNAKGIIVDGIDDFSPPDFLMLILKFCIEKFLEIFEKIMFQWFIFYVEQ